MVRPAANLALTGTRTASEESRGPSILEIETAGDAIDVEDFTSEI
jgi:hypothetical protein